MKKTKQSLHLPSRVKRVLLIVLAVALAAAACAVWWFFSNYRNYNAYRDLIVQPSAYTEGAAFQALPDENKYVPGFSLAAENERVALYVKLETAETAVYDKRNGCTVYSNPQDADQDPVARATNLENLKSQFILSYLDANAKEGTAWSSYAKAVANGQVSYEQIENGVRVVYNLSNEKILLVPDQLTAEWYDILSQSGRKQAAKSYVLNEESGLYELKTQGVSARNRQQIDLDARTAGFTIEDYESMQALRTAEDEAQASENTSFTVALDWQLTDDGVQVTVSYAGLGEFGNSQIRAIQLLPFFGAAGAEETGDLVLPNGSGALMHFNNGKSASAQYNQNIYDLEKHGKHYRE